MKAVVIALALLLIAPAASADHHTSKKLGVVLSCVEGAWLRDGPGIRYKYMTNIEVGTLLPVFKTFERNWLQATYKGRKGWVHRLMVKWDYQLKLHKRFGKSASCSEPLPQES
ncbi:MAG: SH3 domain-containing protein [Pseudomonadota bacterium]|nr:SH3 domain-containing protein [Pseudomonadota bacterium]